MGTITIDNIRFVRTEFQFHPVDLPAVPVVELTMDEYYLTQPNGERLPGSTGGRPARIAVLNPRPSETARGFKEIGSALQTRIQNLMASVADGVAADVEPVVVQNAEGGTVTTYGTVRLESPLVVTPAFGNNWAPDLPNFKLSVRYSRRNAAGDAYLGPEERSQVIGSDGWNLDLTVAGQLMGAKIAEVRAEEGV